MLLKEKEEEGRLLYNGVVGRQNAFHRHRIWKGRPSSWLPKKDLRAPSSFIFSPVSCSSLVSVLSYEKIAADWLSQHASV